MAIAKTTAVLIDEAMKAALEILKKIGPMMMYDVWEETCQSSTSVFDDDAEDYYREATEEEQLVYWEKLVSDWSKVYENMKAREDNAPQ